MYVRNIFMQMKILTGAVLVASLAFATESAEIPVADGSIQDTAVATEASAPAEQIPQNVEAPSVVPVAEVPTEPPAAEASVIPEEAPVAEVSGEAVPNEVPEIPEVDLPKLTAQDTDNFEEYSNRIKFIEENIGLCEAKLETLMKSVADSIPALAPKAEGETDEAFLERQNQYELDVYKASRQKEDVALYMKRVSDMKLAVNTIKKIQTEMLATLLVTSVPEKASVKISNQDITLMTPAKFEQILPGELTVSVFLDGYEPKDFPLVLKARENREMSVSLTPVTALADAAKDAITEDSSWTWRGYTRLIAFIAAASFVGVGVYENYKAVDRADEYNSLKIRTVKARAEAQDDVNQYEILRNAFYATAGVCAGVGVITFFF